MAQVALLFSVLIVLVTFHTGCAKRQVTKGEPQRSTATLPGANRIYPSQQNAQETRPGAPEAFPSAGAWGSSRGSGDAPSYPEPGSSAASSGASSAASGSTASSSAVSGSTASGSTASGSAASGSTASGSTTSGSTATAGRSWDTSSQAGQAAGQAISSYFSVQLWTSTSEEKATQRKDTLQKEFDVPLRVAFTHGLYRVCAGEFSTETEALELQRRSVGRGLVDAQVVSIPAGSTRP